MKFVLFVEGHTEKKALPQFLKKWLDLKLEERSIQPVGIKVVRFEGWPQFVKDTPQKARMHLNEPGKNDVIAVIALLDLYGPTFYPATLTDRNDRHDWAKKHMEDQVGDPRFFQFFAVHEVEAWLLSDPGIFPVDVRNAFPAKVDQPETVNFTEPPAKLLERLYPLHTGRSYKKVVNGKELFGKLDPNIAYGKCPKLKVLLDKMLGLAEASH